MLTDYRIDPSNGQKPECLVIFFHGYGSSADLMKGYVGGLLAPLLPEARLHFPDAPIQMGFNNHSWFEVRDQLQDVPGPDKDVIAARARAATVAANQYIDGVLAESGLSPERVIVAGFSQGGTMAFYTGLLREQPVGGVFALSGGAMEKLTDPVSKPPVLLLAGERELQDYSGVYQAEKTYDLLKNDGFSVENRVLPDQGHQITQKSIELLRDFTRTVVSSAPPIDVSAKNAEKTTMASLPVTSGPRPRL